jgi:hypothetical protein
LYNIAIAFWASVLVLFILGVEVINILTEKKLVYIVEALLNDLDNAVSSRQQPSEPAAAAHDVQQPNKASSATKELDDLMASLSDFKVNVQTVGPAQSVKHNDDYAKPQRATSSNKPSPQGLFSCYVFFSLISFHMYMSGILAVMKVF